MTFSPDIFPEEEPYTNPPIAYDVVCPSDYMVQRMIENDLLAEINYENVPNLKYIDDIYMEMSKQYDP